MRKSVFLSLLLTAMLYFMACEPSTPANESTDPEMTEADSTSTDAESTQSSTTEGDGYTITVVDSEPKSPRKEMKTTIGGAQITVNYGSPAVKGREIFGALEPWDKVWRAGANEATTFTTSADLSVEGQPLPAGKYAFFIEPHEEGSWTVIFNSVYDQWGAYEYDQSKDVLRVEVNPKMDQPNAEQLDYMLKGDAVVMVWEKAAVPVMIAAKE